MVYYSPSDIPGYDSKSFSLGDTTDFTFQLFDPGKTYQFLVTALDSSNRESDYSNIIAAPFISKSKNNAPSFFSQNYNLVAYTSVPYQCALLASDPDGDNLSFSLPSSPMGMSIDNTGRINWTPSSSQIGLNSVAAIVSDGKGLTDSISFAINALDSMASLSRIAFDMGTYISFNSTAFINLTNLKLNRCATRIDSAFVHISSQTDHIGFDVTSHEKSANSGQFAATFVLDSVTIASEGRLKVHDGDSLFVSYYDSILAKNLNVTSLFHQFQKTQTYTFQNGWNLISLPISVADCRKQTLFPQAISRAFAFSRGYKTEDSLECGKGYWLKFPAGAYSNIGGNMVLAETVSVDKGWNIIGSISKPIVKAQISSTPPNLTTSNLYGYNGSSYFVTDTIQPAGGYWIRVDTSGYLILNSNPSSNISNRIRIIPTSELPPTPPNERSVSSGFPEEYVLEEAFPNPFNLTTIIKYQLPSESMIRLGIYNVMGQRVQVLVDGAENAGYKQVEWNASAFASGVYFYRLDATSSSDPSQTFTQVKKMIFIK